MARLPGSPAAPVSAPVEIVVEGDSWEHLPDLGLITLPTVGGVNYDLSRALADLGHTIHNIAYWGDTIAAIAAAGDYFSALVHSKAPFLLLGGGGNDLLADGRLKTYLRLYEPSLTPRDYILDTFYHDLRSVILHYESIILRIAAERAISKTRIIVHGYDYARPMRLGWLGEPMKFVGLDRRPALQAGIVKVLIDALNTELAAMAKRHKTVTHVDFRGRVGDRWHDELHPTKAAFGDPALLVQAALA